MKHRFLDNYKPSIEYALSYSFIIVTLRNLTILLRNLTYFNDYYYNVQI